MCTCRSFQPTYTGNLNFVKGALAGAARLDGRLDIVLTNCSDLQLELNFHTLSRRPVDLRIENSGSVRVIQVELAAWGNNAGADGQLPHVQGLTVQRVNELVLQGAISCARCKSNSAFNHCSCFYLNTIVILYLLSDAALASRAFSTYRSGLSVKYISNVFENFTL